jgi:hypothetical protein
MVPLFLLTIVSTSLYITCNNPHIFTNATVPLQLIKHRYIIHELTVKLKMVMNSVWGKI